MKLQSRLSAGFLFGAAMALAASLVFGQHVQETSVGLGLGFSTSGFGNRPVVLSEDTVAVMSDGYQLGGNNLQTGVVSFSGLSRGIPQMQFLPFEANANLPGEDFLLRRLFRLSDHSAIYLGSAEWDQGKGHIVVFKNLGNGQAGEVVFHGDLPVTIWPKGWGEPAVLDDETAVFPSPGHDGFIGSSDDTLLLCTGIGTNHFQVSTYVVGSGLSTRITRLSNGLAVVNAYGPDNYRATSDDVLLIIQAQGGLFSVTSVSPGLPLGSWLDGIRPVAVAPDAVVYPTTSGLGQPVAGVTAAYTLIRNLTSIPESLPLESLPLAAMTQWGAPHPVAIGNHAMAHLSPGPDLAVGSLDDELVIVRNLDTTPTVETHAAGVGLGLNIWPRQPLLLKDRIILGSYGLDQSFGTNDDGLMTVSHLESAIPAFSFIPLGNAPLDIQRVNDNVVWVLMLFNSPLTVSGLHTGSISLSPMALIQPAPIPPASVNDWTLFDTAAGLFNGSYLNDTARFISFPFAEEVGQGTTGGAGSAPVLAMDTLPVIGAGWVPVHLSGAFPGAPCALYFSRVKTQVDLAPQLELFIDTDQLVTFLEGQTDPLGNKNFWMEMPSDPSLAGRSWASQAVVMDPTAAYGFTLSNGLVLHL